jgi:uncharacterized membrane protein SpoIIM required for sporulation
LKEGLEKMNASFWKNASPRMKRIYSVIAVFFVAFIATVAGSLVPLSAQDAQSITKDLNQTVHQNQANNTLFEYIFFNNFRICLLMFIPVLGACLGLFILFDTGVALGAIASTQGYPVWLSFVSLMVTPVFWLEFAAYSLAMAESVWLFRRLMQRRWSELKWTALFIVITAVLLVVGAVVESWMITS